jgi:hypothetical protein
VRVERRTALDAGIRMRPVTQSRIGEDGRCFPACIASILELSEASVPDLDNTNEQQVNAFLAPYNLRYQEIPITDDSPIPVGYHVICGVSPRGGMHAVVGRDGAFAHDPHPISDDPRRGVVKPLRWGLLIPANDQPNFKALDTNITSRFIKGRGVEGGWVPETGGKVNVKLDGKKIGEAGVAKVRGSNAWRITTARVNPSLVGKGFGKHLYTELVKQAATHGITELVSTDKHRSPGAEHAWQQLAKTHGAVNEDGVWRVKAKDAGEMRTGLPTIAPIKDARPPLYDWSPKDAPNLRAIISNLKATVQMIESAQPLTPERQREADGYKAEIKEWERLLAKCGVMERRGGKDAEPWNDADTSRYRVEVERRFKERTPPQRPDEVLWESRVMRGEMRSWAQQVLGKLPPESDERWLNQHGTWYQSMAKRYDPSAVKKRKAKDRADMMALRRNTQRQGGPFHVQLTEPDGMEHTASVKALRAYDAVCRGCGNPLPIRAQYCETCKRNGKAPSYDAVDPIPPYRPGDVIKLANGKRTTVKTCTLGENLFHEPEWHVLTASGDVVTVKMRG